MLHCAPHPPFVTLVENEHGRLRRGEQPAAPQVGRWLYEAKLMRFSERAERMMAGKVAKAEGLMGLADEASHLYRRHHGR